ncbi:hypothetical protein CPB86DRAFT_782334 [Serendipita vermifera]|nr:hypothetical protein CPB86DRAFT_782334 [Serendipita vermifera]
MVVNIAIGKRRRAVRLGRPSTSQPSYGDYLQTGERIETSFDGHYLEEASLHELRSNVDQPTGPNSPTLELRPRGICTRIIPQSEDCSRLARFRLLVAIFHSRFESILSDTILDSAANTLFLDEELLRMLDEGNLSFQVIDQKVYPLPFGQGETNKLGDSMNSISPPKCLREVSKRAQELGRKNISSDEEIILLHALILNTWVGTGLSERFHADMEWIENLPASSQRVCVLGDDLFGRLLQHKLSIM